MEGVDEVDTENLPRVALPMATIYDEEAVEVLRKQAAVQPHTLKRFRNVLFKQAAGLEEALEILPVEQQAGFREGLQAEVLTLHEARVSEIDGAEKLIFRTVDDHLIETVILKPESGRTAVCISSQVGCACYCSFCATGLMGFSRNLSVAEILDQVRWVNRRIKTEGRSVRNVVFMGMGEPLLNQAAVFEAVERLVDPAWFNLSGSHVTVSTVGIAPGMRAFTERLPTCRLALSLHSARQSVRERIIPQARKYPLSVLKEVLEKAETRGTVMIEYILLKDLTDRPEDLTALVDFLGDLPVHLNLIPFNSFIGSNLEGTSYANCTIFCNKLKKKGLKVTLRHSLGADIMAACGQLVQHKLKIDKNID